MDKLITDKLSLNLDQNLRNDLVDNFEKIQKGVDGQSDSLNKQIKDMLGDVPLQDQNEVTQARIDSDGQPHSTLKGRLDETQDIAQTALDEERDANVELRDARGEFETLGLHEQSQNKDIETNANGLNLANEKIDLAVNMAQSAVSGTPKGTFKNLEELKNNFPNGDGAIYVTTDTGHWYYWSNGWRDGGIYQGAIEPDVSKLKDRKVLNQFNVTPVIGQRLGGAKDDGTVNIYPVSDSAYTNINIADVPNEVLVVPYSGFTQGQFMILVDGSGQVIQNYSHKQINDLKAGEKISAVSRYIEVRGENVYIFIKTLRGYYDFKQLYFGFPNKAKANIYYLDSINLQDYAPWLKNNQPTLISKRLYAQTSKRYDVATKLPVFEKYNGTNVLFFDLAAHQAGTLTIPMPKLIVSDDGTYPVTQLLYRLDSNGHVFENMGYDTTTGYPKIKESKYLTATDTELIFDLNKIEASQLVLIVPSNYSLDFYEKYEGVFGIEELEPSVKLNESKINETDLNLPLMVPVTTGQDQYIYFDSLIKNRNIYNHEVTAIAKNMLDDHAIINATSDGEVTITFDSQTDITVPYKVLPEKISGNYNLLTIGESTTEADAYMTGLRDYLADSGANITFMGSRTSSINQIPMEAYSGWGAGTLRYVSEANDRKNEFYNPDTKVFDYDYYLAQHPEQHVPDICLINFGINPTNRYVDSGQTTTQSQNIQFIISQIRAKNRDCKFIVGLTHYAARWSNYWADPSARREEILQGVADLIDYFGNRENENIYLNPMFVSLDPRWDMQYEEVNTNRNSEHKSYHGLDNHHPSSIGYKNNAYSTVNAIKYAILN